jgi:acetoin utilization protein AcuB
MSSNVPTVGQYMSRTTITVAPRQTIQEARDLMMKHHIRHLPVLDSGRLVGLVSQHDLDTASSNFDGNAASIRVDYAMATDVYTVRPDTPLDAVAAHLSEKRFGSTVVMEGDSVVGVFTMVDACRALIATSREDPRLRRSAERSEATDPKDTRPSGFLGPERGCRRGGM